MAKFSLYSTSVVLAAEKPKYRSVWLRKRKMSVHLTKLPSVKNFQVSLMLEFSIIQFLGSFYVFLVYFGDYIGS